MKEWFWSHAKMLIGIFISTLAIKSGGLLGKLFGSAGLAWITYKYAMPEIRTYMLGYMSGLPSDVYDLVTYCRFDGFMSLLLSAAAVRFASGLMLGKADGS